MKKRGPKPSRKPVPGYRHGPFVAEPNEAILRQWRNAYSLPLGRIIDNLVQHVRNDPGFKLYLAGQRSPAAFRDTRFEKAA